MHAVCFHVLRAGSTCRSLPRRVTIDTESWRDVVTLNCVEVWKSSTTTGETFRYFSNWDRASAWKNRWLIYNFVWHTTERRQSIETFPFQSPIYTAISHVCCVLRAGKNRCTSKIGLLLDANVLPVRPMQALGKGFAHQTDQSRYELARTA